MADVVRFSRQVEEITYTVGPDTLRHAILAWLTNEHGAAFTETTVVKFCEGNSVAVTTAFPQETPHA